MLQSQRDLVVSTHGSGLYEITESVASFATDCKIATGLLTLYCRHTSASLLIQENADPDVQRDLQAYFKRLVPDGDPLFVHTTEGPDDMPAHVKAALTQTSLSIPIADGRLVLGTWQGIYLFEHRRAPHRRTIVLHVIGG
jgi:secondary thiamine-phosphate synthase enzyme